MKEAPVARRQAFEAHCHAEGLAFSDFAGSYGREQRNDSTPPLLPRSGTPRTGSMSFHLVNTPRPLRPVYGLEVWRQVLGPTV